MTATVLPKSVQAKVDQANELTRQAAAAAPTGTPQAATGTPATAPADDAAKENARLKTELEKATKAYGVLKGKYDAEVPRLAEDIRKANEKIAELEKARPAPPAKLTSVTEEDERVFGKELIGLVRRVTDETSRTVAETLIDTKIKPIVERQDVFEQQSEAEYFATLDDLAPTWREQNKDQQFLAWLQGIDHATGRQRIDLLKRAESLAQGRRVAEIFLAFQENREIGARAAAPANLSPGPGSGSPPPAPDQAVTGKIWTRADIGAFYTDVRTGKYKGREEEKRSIERDISLAQHEGRYRG